MIAPDGTVLTRASETLSWMFADAGLALQGGTTEEDDPDLMKGKLTAESGMPSRTSGGRNTAHYS